MVALVNTIVQIGLAGFFETAFRSRLPLTMYLVVEKAE